MNYSQEQILKNLKQNQILSANQFVKQKVNEFLPETNSTILYILAYIIFNVNKVDINNKYALWSWTDNYQGYHVFAKYTYNNLKINITHN